MNIDINDQRNWIMVCGMIFVTFCPAFAQGLKGTPTLDHIPGRPAPLIKAANDKARWGLIYEHAVDLIGMRAAQVEKTFGPAERSGNEMFYEVTQIREPSKKGTLSNLSLRIVLKNGRVISYRIDSVTWG